MAENDSRSGANSEESSNNSEGNFASREAQVNNFLAQLNLRFARNEISLKELYTILNYPDASSKSPLAALYAQLVEDTRKNPNLSEQLTWLEIRILDTASSIAAEYFELKINDLRLAIGMGNLTEAKQKKAEKELAKLAQELFTDKKLIRRGERKAMFADKILALQDVIGANKQTAPQSAIPEPISPDAVPPQPPAAPKTAETNAAKDSVESEIEMEIEEFDKFIDDLSTRLKKSDFDPFEEYGDYENAMKALDVTTEDFYQIVVGLLESSPQPSQKRKGVQLRRKYESKIAVIKSELEAKSRSLIKGVDRKWKDNPRYEGMFPELTELRAIYESSPSAEDISAQRADILTLLEQFDEKLAESNLSEQEKQTIAKTYIKDVFDLMLEPFYQVSEEVNSFRLDNASSRTSDALDALQSKFNTQYRWILSLRFQSFFKKYFPGELERTSKEGERTNQFDNLSQEIKESQLDSFSYEELARWCKRLNADPFGFSKAREGTQDPYKALVISKVKERLFGPNPEDSPWENHERQRWYIWLALKFMNDKMQNASESATATKTAKRLFENKEETSLENELRAHAVTREVLIKVTTADPEYGKYYQELIKAIKIKAALKAPPKNVDPSVPSPEVAMGRLERMTAEEMRIENPIMTTEGQVAYIDGKFYAYSDAVKYDTLINESRGRAVMSGYLASIKRPPGISEEAAKMALNMAELIYPTFTILDESFYELQASTQTRGHNTQEDDFGSIHKPTTTAVHRAVRYSEMKTDAIAMWSPYKISNIHTDEHHDHHAVVNHDAEDGDEQDDLHHKRNIPHELMPKNYVLSEAVTQLLLKSFHGHKLHQECFYDTDLVFGKVDFPGFMEQVFPGASALFTMHAQESLWIPDPTLKTKKKSDLTPSDLTEMLVDSKGAVLARSNSQGEIFSADGANLLARLKDTSGGVGNPALLAKLAEETAPGQTKSQIQGFIEFVSGPLTGQTLRLNDDRAKIDLPGGGKVSALGFIDDVPKYFQAFDGLKKINEMVFSKIPGGLSAGDIIDKSSTGKGLLHELMSAFGVLKLFPSMALEKLATPYMGMYVLKLVQFFKPARPQERMALVNEIVNQLTRSGTYGGLSVISKSVTRVVEDMLVTYAEPDRSKGQTFDEEDALTASPWGRFKVTIWEDSEHPVDTKVYARHSIWRYMESRQEHINNYIAELWHEEFGNIPVPPFGDTFDVGWKMKAWEMRMRMTNQVINPDMIHLIEASRNEAAIPTFLNLKAKFEVEDKKAKGDHK